MGIENDIISTLTTLITCSARKILENRSLADEERMDALENQLKEARFLAEEADKKYDEVQYDKPIIELLAKLSCSIAESSSFLRNNISTITTNNDINNITTANAINNVTNTIDNVNVVIGTDTDADTKTDVNTNTVDHSANAANVDKDINTTAPTPTQVT